MSVLFREPYLGRAWPDRCPRCRRDRSTCSQVEPSPHCSDSSYYCYTPETQQQHINLTYTHLDTPGLNIPTAAAPRPIIQFSSGLHPPGIYTHTHLHIYDLLFGEKANMRPNSGLFDSRCEDQGQVCCTCTYIVRVVMSLLLNNLLSLLSWTHTASSVHSPRDRYTSCDIHPRRTPTRPDTSGSNRPKTQTHSEMNI